MNDSWVEVGKKVVSLVTATATALVAGISLAGIIVSALILATTRTLYASDRLHYSLVILLLLLLFPATVVASVWLGRRSRIPGPLLAWFLLGVGLIGPALLALFALTYHGDD